MDEVKVLATRPHRMDIKLTKDGNYRPDTLIINGELASMTLFLEKHGWNWRSRPYGNVLYYRTETGKEYSVKQQEVLRK